MKEQHPSDKPVYFFGKTYDEIEAEYLKEGYFDYPEVVEYMVARFKSGLIDYIVQAEEIKKKVADIFASYGLDIKQYTADSKDEDAQKQLIISMFGNGNPDADSSHEEVNPSVYQAIDSSSEPTISQLLSLDQADISVQDIDTDPEIEELTKKMKSTYKVIIMLSRLIYMVNKHRDNPQAKKEIQAEVLNSAMLMYIASHPV